jgi:hypothetical protein
VKQQKRWTGLIVVSTLLVLACAPCGLSNLLERTGDAVVAEVEEIAESAVQEAAETTEESAEDQASSQAEDIGDQQAVQPAEESVTASEESATVGMLNIPNNPQDSLAKFDSYQLEYQIEAQTTAEVVSTTLLIERTEDAQHIVMQNEGDAAQMGDFDRIEIFVETRDGQTKMYMQNPPDQGWTAITVNSLDEALGILPLSPNSFSAFPQQGRMVEENVDINGVPTTHLTVSEQEFLGAAPGIEEAQGDIWINEDMDLVMKAIIRVKGSGLSLANQPVQFASYTMICEVKKLDDPSIVIIVPEAALNSSGLAIPGTSTDSDQFEFPTPPGANIELAAPGILNLTVDSTVPKVWQFYQQSLGSDNLQTTLETSTNIMATYTGGTEPVQFMIVDEGNVIRVVIAGQ